MFILNGQVITDDISIKQKDYESLPIEERKNGATFYISDDGLSEHERISNLNALIGNKDLLSTTGGDGTIIGAIVELYNRLGGLSFQMNEETNIYESYYNTGVTPVTVPTLKDDATDSERLAYFESIFGSAEKLGELGVSSIVGAIDNLYRRLGGLTFSYDEVDDNLTVNYISENPTGKL